MAVVAAGCGAVKRTLNFLFGVDTDQASDAIDRNTIETTIDQQGIGAVTDEGVLRTAIDTDAPDAAVDLDELRNGVADSISTGDREH